MDTLSTAKATSEERLHDVEERSNVYELGKHLDSDEGQGPRPNFCQKLSEVYEKFHSAAQRNPAAPFDIVRVTVCDLRQLDSGFRLAPGDSPPLGGVLTPVGLLCGRHTSPRLDGRSSGACTVVVFCVGARPDPSHSLDVHNLFERLAELWVEDGVNDGIDEAVHVAEPRGQDENRHAWPTILVELGAHCVHDVTGEKWHPAK
uniref:Uncharacterized protein n=1 Tax=Anopheles atroparvus TaxID=41427 RepID=A0A182IWB8_ANOAO